MPLRFWRRISILPGVTLNISKTGVSVTLGFRGARWTIGRRGHTASVGLPGTGLSYREQVSHESAIEGVRKLTDDEPTTAPKGSSRDARDSAWSDFK